MTPLNLVGADTLAPRGSAQVAFSVVEDTPTHIQGARTAAVRRRVAL
jgi:hypothetical protein